MTFKTSAVAVCCSSASCSSLAGLLGLSEARVFNGDDRLVREGVHELDLAFSEWAHFGAPD